MFLKHCLGFGLFIVCTSSAVIDNGWYEKRSAPQPVVQLHPNNVTFHGTTSRSVESFLNIKFGSDTGGQNRFAPPRPYTYRPNSGVDASRSGAACPQQKIPIPGLPLFDPVANISEDCLTLRVDRPAGTPENAKLPVMVYLYGGGNTLGQIYDGAYDPSNLVLTASQKGFPVIYAAMNYRLNIFGFAASQALEAADSLNVGLLDQRLALEWIQEHISAFGGDPAKVTIFGESAGASAVALQITAYGGRAHRAPFQRAIMQSGGATADGEITNNFSANSTAAVIANANCTSRSSQQELLCLRQLPLSTLLNATYQYALSSAQWGLGVFGPVAPSSFIPDSPSTLLYTGRFTRDIDMVSGWNENDNSLFVDPTTKSIADIAKLFPTLSNASLTQALDLYPVVEFESNAMGNISAQYFRASQMARDSQYSCASVLMVQANINFSRCETTNYLFALNQSIFTNFFKAHGAPYYGVSHFSDIPYVFNQATTRFVNISSPSDKTVSSLMSGSWAAFAASGHTSGRNGTLSNWPEVGNHTADIRIIAGSDARVQNTDNYEQLMKRCSFWNSPQILRQLQT